eukprot:CAMPEP_0185759550 /NCGR_PEP_ID=MMETSP1174-20130828/18290_1 /TAXON_ID=35687 /ORGANISM="Dictyocha speculum, Strain CCMP1381" /LENGTH=73 /DNA_ID=CAMNT_0028439925 /DNA_START=301 /DNA_END=522 /DNA_ORIENTATION=+
MVLDFHQRSMQTSTTDTKADVGACQRLKACAARAGVRDAAGTCRAEGDEHGADDFPKGICDETAIPGPESHVD